MSAARILRICLLSCIAAAAQEQAPLPSAIPVDEAELVVPEEAPDLVPVPEGGNVPRPTVVPPAVSKSRMFAVRGGAGNQRSSVALALEQQKNAFHQLLTEEPDNLANPFVQVQLMEPPREQSVEYALTIAAGQPVLNVRMTVEAEGVDREKVSRIALTSVLYHRAMKGADDADLDEPLIVRPWLVEGLVEAGKWQEGTADRRLYEAVFRSGGGFTLDELFELPQRSYERLDSASRLSFRVLSGALIMALVEQPKGREGFRNFCAEAARFAGEMPVLLRRHFPELNLSERSLSKWWALTLAKLVQPTLTEVLNVSDTERELTAALRFRRPDPEMGIEDVPLDAWREIVFLEQADRTEAVRSAEDGLVRLSYRCFPSYRPLVREYQEILRTIADGKERGVQEKLDALAEQRVVRLQHAIRARDFLDFFEISRARDLSGEFEDYMRLKKELELRPRPQRHDHLTQVLDTMQKVYEPKVRRRPQ